MKLTELVDTLEMRQRTLSRSKTTEAENSECAHDLDKAENDL